MSDVTLDSIESGYNLSKINSNFDKVENVINDEVLHRVGGNNTMGQDLDMNGHGLLNIGTNIDDPDSLLTVGEADLRYYNVAGDKLEGPMDVAGQEIVGLKLPSADTSPVRKMEFDSEVARRMAADTQEAAARAAADANLQAQINGDAVPVSSQFSPISWHPQTIDNSVNIPAGVNAWSFGPTMTISQGQVVTLGVGSFWTIANGEVNQ